MSAKIVSVEIGPVPGELGDPPPTVHACFDDGTQRHLIRFYPDEITFTEDELIGLTEVQAHELHGQKDVHYLQS